MTIASRPKVSVCLITYNHERYISEALAGALNQQTTFPFEIVIGEDGSQDGTPRIIKDLIEKQTDIVRARFNSPNQGMMRNLLQTLNECRGEYIALLEGDDYWTDPNKLQRQVTYLDTHPEFAISFHPVDILQNGTLIRDDRTREVSEDSGIIELADGNFMHTCSVVFRAGLFEKYPDNFLESPVGDYYLHMLNARFGRIHRHAEKMGVYRVHEAGAWSTKPDMDLKVLDYLELMIGQFDPEINARLQRRHATVAFRAFLHRLTLPGSERRLERCFRYGTSDFSRQLVPWMEESVRARRHPAVKLAMRLFGNPPV